MDPTQLGRPFHPIHGPSFFVDLIQSKLGDDAANKVTEVLGRAGAVPWLKILLALMPFIIALLSGKPVDLQAIIAAIEALIGGG